MEIDFEDKLYVNEMSANANKQHKTIEDTKETLIIHEEIESEISNTGHI